MLPSIKCPKCFHQESIDQVLTAQSNQNVIYQCPKCQYEVRNIHTKKG